MADKSTKTIQLKLQTDARKATEEFNRLTKELKETKYAQQEAAAAGDKEKLSLIAQRRALDDAREAQKKATEATKRHEREIKDATAAANKHQQAIDKEAAALEKKNKTLSLAGAATVAYTAVMAAAAAAVYKMIGYIGTLIEKGVAWTDDVASALPQIQKLSEAVDGMIPYNSLGKVIDLGKAVGLTSKEIENITKLSIIMGRDLRITNAAAIDKVSEAFRNATFESIIPFLGEMNKLTGTKAEQRQQVLDALSKKIGDVGISAENTAEQMDKMNIAMGNYESAIGKQIADSSAYIAYLKIKLRFWTNLSGILTEATTKIENQTLEEVKNTIKHKQWAVDGIKANIAVRESWSSLEKQIRSVFQLGDLQGKGFEIIDLQEKSKLAIREKQLKAAKSRLIQIEKNYADASKRLDNEAHNTKAQQQIKAAQDELKIAEDAALAKLRAGKSGNNSALEAHRRYLEQRNKEQAAFNLKYANDMEELNARVIEITKTSLEEFAHIMLLADEHFKRSRKGFGGFTRAGGREFVRNFLGFPNARDIAAAQIDASKIQERHAREYRWGVIDQENDFQKELRKNWAQNENAAIKIRNAALKKQIDAKKEALKEEKRIEQERGLLTAQAVANALVEAKSIEGFFANVTAAAIKAIGDRAVIEAGKEYAMMLASLAIYDFGGAAAHAAAGTAWALLGGGAYIGGAAVAAAGNPDAAYSSGSVSSSGSGGYGTGSGTYGTTNETRNITNIYVKGRSGLVTKRDLKNFANKLNSGRL